MSDVMERVMVVPEILMEFEGDQSPPPMLVYPASSMLWTQLQAAERGEPWATIVYTSPYGDAVKYAQFCAQWLQYQLWMRLQLLYDDSVEAVIRQHADELFDETALGISFPGGFTRTVIAIDIRCWMHGEALRKWADDSRFNPTPGRQHSWSLPVENLGVYLGRN